MNKKILVIGERQKEKAKKLGFSENEIIIANEDTTLHDIRHLIADNPSVKKVLTPTFGALSTNFNEFDSFVGYCMSNKINIFVVDDNMSLYEVDDNGTIKRDKQGNDNISIAFKTRILIVTDFEHF